MLETSGNLVQKRMLSNLQLRQAVELHSRVPPAKWCITRSEFDAFVQEVYQLWCAHKIPETEVNELYWDERHGPNLYEVNRHVVKPITLAAGGVSYALMKHPDGLDCEVFVSHSWHGGIFHLQRGVRNAWPQLHKLRNLYCCLLANPQNLELNQFIGGDLRQSAFALALYQASHLLVVPNPSTGVYSRLWCVYEAYLGATWDKIYLLPVIPNRMETLETWFKEVGVKMLCALAIGVPLFLTLKATAFDTNGILTWISFIYRVLSLAALLLLIPYRHSSSALGFMTALALAGAVFTVTDLAWGVDLCNVDNFVSVFFHYGYLSNLTLVNTLVTLYLVQLAAEKASFEQQKDMMQFRSVQDAHCSRADDEQRIRQAIAGAEQEVETVIRILLAAGAYTDNLRHCWDHGINIDRKGQTDVMTDLRFTITLWFLNAMDLAADIFIGNEGYESYFGTLCGLYCVTITLIPFSIMRLEKEGPDHAVFGVDTWTMSGMFSLQLPMLLCFLQGYDEAIGMRIMDLFDASVLNTVDHDSWYGWRFNRRITRTILASRLLCLIITWLIVLIGVGRCNKMRVGLEALYSDREKSLLSDTESDE